ncbi:MULTISPECIES: lytic polysaccharide monooxygenase [Streptomyces]|uniref:Lytic polysaccharide monooxygenase n=1 Tax=Streptomyces koelreuteriae TaxID=2838015 RepID=A0ABX8FMK5_9ACTN|nr:MULTISPECIES: lytic polysaccharide monooxygenase [Streptomyces]QWB22353.1 lytic polysaccharide monooxygenase [Streptomyces koelreuteriae]UUA05294.1 lytic polysaccharide monooxygenase [Streptomyces koelreuteriae]UUA12920.1 lytic polysaccharide monooxygenase [Streptomyces sp. CRCS-T-1]
MPRTTAHRTALAAALVTPLLLPLWAAGPAGAHGAPTDPVSRVVACSPEGGERAGSAACRAAVAANGAPFTAWDNLRIANVNGRDRQVVPDGKLCSGGLPAYRGLDLARADWPSTRMTPGATLTMRYVSTIPHTGTFRMYLTKPGYDPAGPLSWSDLPEKPFAEVTDPALTDGAYRMKATLPSDRTGRHVLYTVWQNSSTPDTYYSCSDVVFPEKAAASPEEKEQKESEKTEAEEEEKEKEKEKKEQEQKQDPAENSAAPQTPQQPQQQQPQDEHTPVAATSGPGSGPSTPMLAGGAAAVLLLTGGAALAVRLRRR